ncbi:G2/M phase-specific E3 ubiquitin-protein ligase-like [Phlebotomus argentipes]|uniref:G2/M phase-specific E3 ubiquitin-protein ligase-like n=1 Tax=Phlebotomus argentipes TaxID=94469 RepID=UPI0028934E07|nr:G2/M phase-specific E3 ubiquitin-protein ligase-like [Phlebotomus argentipes]
MNCIVCKEVVDSPLLYGDKFRYNDIYCHYYCLLFSTTIKQTGADNEGIQGFIYRDILQGVDECRKYLCCYCKLPYASVQCGYDPKKKRKCTKLCHFTCGARNKWLFQFDEMKAFCPVHTGLPAKMPPEFVPGRTCLICSESFSGYSALECIPAHCRPDIWIHRDCLQTFALHAGYGLKCLICRHSEFRRIAQKRGVFVPNRDIDWMLNQCEGGSQDPSAPPLICAARCCIADGGREFPPGSQVGGTCFTCENVFHTNCARFNGRKTANDNFMCFGCDEKDSEILEPPDTVPRKNTLVQLSKSNVIMKKFLYEVYRGKVDYVDQSLMPQFYGPRCAANGKFRLNYFLNSY